MTRLPFDPNRIKPNAAQASPAAPQAISVSQLSALVRTALATLPGKLHVVGEVSNFSARSHWFFSMKDAGATIKCVCFASNVRRIKFPVKDGMQVVATGRLDYYDAQGSLQLYVDTLEPVGQGSLELQYRALCDELRKLGYFDAARKKPLPAVPLRVAVITSKTGAALQDVINTARQRWKGCELLVFDVRVQGAQAAPEVARAIDLVSRDGPALGIDAIILTRGGGSIEDLWAFNERIVADALFRCRIPTVAAIGHETDTTIAELVADLRAATPTQAAMQLIPDQNMLMQQVEQYTRRLTQQLQRQTQHARQRLDSLEKHPYFRTPDRMLDPARTLLATLEQRLRAELPRRAAMAEQQLAGLRRRLPAAVIVRHAREKVRAEALQRSLAALGPRVVAAARADFNQLDQSLSEAAARRLARAKDQTDALERQLRAVGPQRVLDRGFSYTLNAEGKVLRSPSQVQPGERIVTVLAEGKVGSVVEGAGTMGKVGAQRPKKQPAKPQAAEDGGLFGEVEK